MSSSPPDSEPSYVSGPKTRGTVDLIWNCSITLGLCIWTVVHPNIIPWPRFRDQMLYKLSWLIGAVIFPEILVVVAFSQLREARAIRRSWKENVRHAEARKWLGLPGAFFAAMGGFVTVQPLYTEPDVNPASTPKRYVTTVRASGFRKLLELDVINRCIADGTLNEAAFSQRNISDKGKADSVAKALLCIQIAWMCLQCLGRTLDGLPVTLLEGHLLIQILFATMAHPIPLPLNIGPLVSTDYICVGPGRVEPHHDSRADFLTEEVGSGGFFRMFFRAAYDALSYHSARFEVLAAVLGAVNGGLHLIAWDAHFPTGAERLLWRISAFSAGGLFPMFMLWVSSLAAEEPVVRMTLNMSLLGGRDKWNLFSTGFAALIRNVVHDDEVWAPWLPRQARLVVVGSAWVAGVWYSLCMLYLTIGPFLCVRNVPKGAYTVVEWASLFPHF
ncbi:hypothetical protein BJY00DRAFT_322306 [Aspergillus carlsbadensis]|nr:hypothetical protein BJY00DRAFT_322306 [Aspergillus carlsbadensis]